MRRRHAAAIVVLSAGFGSVHLLGHDHAAGASTARGVEQRGVDLRPDLRPTPPKFDFKSPYAGKKSITPSGAFDRASSMRTILREVGATGFVVD